MKMRTKKIQIRHSLNVLLVFGLLILNARAFAQPANDDICGAVPVTCGSTTAGTTVNANNSGTNEANFCGGYAQNTPGVWYSFAGTGQTVTFSLCGSPIFNDSQISVYSGTSCANATCLATNDDNGPACAGLVSSIAIPTVVGTTYYIKIFSWNQLTPFFDFSLAVTCFTPPPPPTNDLICNATAVTCGSATIGTTVGATVGGSGETGTCSGYGQNTPGVWYSFVGNGSVVTASLCNTTPSVDSQIGVFTGSCASPNCLTAVDDFGPSCASLQASVSFQTTIGVTYFIKVWRWSGFYNPNLTIGTFQLDLTCSFSGPPNDPCAGATLVGVPYNSGIVSVAQATTATDGVVPTFASCGASGGALNNTLWYRVIGDGTSYTASTISTSTNFDTEIQVFTGSCGALTNVACSNLYTAGQPCSNPYFEDVTWCTQAGVTYYVMVGSEVLNCTNSNFNLSISSSAVPSTATLYNNDMVWRGGAGVPSVKNTYPYAYDAGEDWTVSTNWFVYDSINNTFIAATAGQVPTLSTNVYIPKLGGCNTKLPVIYNTTAAFANNLTVMREARLTFGRQSAAALGTAGGSLELKGDLMVSGQITAGNGEVFSTLANASTTSNNRGTGLVKFTGSNNQSITHAELNPSNGNPVRGIVNLYDVEVNITGTNTGLVLNLPLYVFRDLKMSRGNILSSSTNYLVLGMHVQSALVPGSALNTYPLLASLYYGNQATPNVSTVTWTAGSVVGPMFKYNRTNTAVTDANSLYPVGGMFNGTITNRNAYLKWATPGAATSVGLLRAQYITGPVPFTTGMPLTDLTPTSVNLTTIATEGYWEIHPYRNFTTPAVSTLELSTGTVLPTPGYNLSLRANQYPSISVNYLDSRIIKTPGAPTLVSGNWQLNGTHNAITGQTADFTVSRNGMSAFSIFAVAVPNLPLAVEFIGANYECKSGGVEFSWSTASEQNSDRFDIETSQDGLNWISYAVQASAGNTTQQTDYRVMLPEPSGDLYYVRLTEHDMDGTATQLGVFALSCSGAGSVFTYPNPSADNFILSISDPKFKGEVDLKVTNAVGESIAEQTGLEVGSGTTNFSIDLTGFAPGVYFISVRKGDLVQTIRQVIQ